VIAQIGCCAVFSFHSSCGRRGTTANYRSWCQFVCTSVAAGAIGYDFESPVMQVHDAASCSVLSAGRSSVDWKDRTDKFWTTKELKEIVDPV